MEEGNRILKSSGLDLITADDLDDAVGRFLACMLVAG